jgi:uncharacterized membrane protein YkvI
MKIASRIYAMLAAFALVLAGVTAVATTEAKAASETTTAIIAGAVITAAIIGAVFLLDSEDEEEPQSP